MIVYRVVDVFWWRVSEELVVFWPVMVRAGRQRKTRAAFIHPGDAAIYGLRLAARYARIYAKTSTLLGACPVGGGHDWPTEPGQIYTGSCRKCGKRR
jgi:hypothetical protein